MARFGVELHVPTAVVETVCICSTALIICAILHVVLKHGGGMCQACMDDEDAFAVVGGVHDDEEGAAQEDGA